MPFLPLPVGRGEGEAAKFRAAISLMQCQWSRARRPQRHLRTDESPTPMVLNLTQRETAGSRSLDPLLVWLNDAHDQSLTSTLYPFFRWSAFHCLMCFFSS